MSASGQQDSGSSCSGVALAGHGEGQSSPKRLPNPVTLIATPQRKKGAVQVIEYYYDHEKGDVVDFEFRTSDKGYQGVFTVTRNSSSSSRNVLDISLAIPKDEIDKFDVEKKLKDKFYRVKLKKHKGSENLDLAKYFNVTKPQLSSSDEEQKSSQVSG